MPLTTINICLLAFNIFYLQPPSSSPIYNLFQRKMSLTNLMLQLGQVSMAAV